MAIEVTLVADVTPEVTAAADLRTHQNKFVQVMAAGVHLADVRSGGYCFTGVLDNKPNTGEACSIMGGPSVRRVIAGEAVTRGAVVQPMSASGLAGVSSWGNTAAVGTAWSTVAGSGEYLGVKLGR